MSNFKGANISGVHNANIGDNNIINSMELNDCDWDLIENEILSVLKNSRAQENQKVLFQDMMNYVQKKDAKGIKAYLKRHMESFNLSFLAGVASTSFMQFITNLIQ